MDNAESPRLGLRFEDLTHDFFQNVVNGIHPGAKLVRFEQTDMERNAINGILSEITRSAEEVIIGIFAFRVHYLRLVDGSNKEQSKDIVLKVRQEKQALNIAYSQFLDQFGTEIGAEWLKVVQNVFWQGDINLTDLSILGLQQPEALVAILPTLYYKVEDKERHIYAYVMDNFASDAEEYSHLNMADNPEIWKHDDVCGLLKHLANFHAEFLGNTDNIPNSVRKHLDTPLTGTRFRGLKRLLSKVYNVGVKNPDPAFVPADIAEMYARAETNLDAIFNVLENAPHTLIHGDCTIRNICMRSNPKPGQSNFVFYDWELARLFPPQLDIVEVLWLWLPADASPETWYKYLEIYRGYLAEAITANGYQHRKGVIESLEPENFKLISDMCFLSYFLLQHLFFFPVATAIPMPFMNRFLHVRDTMAGHVRTIYKFLQ